MSERFDARRARIGDPSLFPDVSADAYLNFAAVSPPSVLVQQAVHRMLLEYATEGVGAVMEVIEEREGLRGLLARLIGAEPEDIGFVTNTSAGVSAVALCMPWSAGDRIVCFHGEFPTNVTPWQRAAARHDLEVVFGDAQSLPPTQGAGLEWLEGELRQGVRLVAVSAVQFQTGLRMPLERIGALCKEYGAELFVDAIQAAGVVPIDVRALGIDYLACGGHKWMLGLEGAGYLYVAPERIGQLEPVVAGWLSHDEPLSFLFEGPGHLRYDRGFKPRAEFVEAGAVNALGYAALGASAELLLALGVERIFEHVTSYLDMLEAGLAERGFVSTRSAHLEERSGILSIPAPDGVVLAELSAAMGERGVAVSTPDGHLRFAPHFQNELDEVDLVLDVFEESVASLRRGHGA